eukprot:Skav223711  [mRNA]  locus=scaffold2564:22209:25329:- [translate_table: standard]
MCRKGYGEEGCAKCVEDAGTKYLMADSNVLACTPCTEGAWNQLFQWISFLAQRAVLFAVSAKSIFGAGRADRVKNSGVYLNQLMAFAAVSGSVVTAVMQTETAQMMKQGAVEYLYGTAVFLSDASSGQGAKSSHCLLSYGAEWVVRSALLGRGSCDFLGAGSFLKGLASGIGGRPQLFLANHPGRLCYRLQENQSDGIEGLICNHLPFGHGNIFGFVAVAS